MDEFLEAAWNLILIACAIAMLVAGAGIGFALAVRFGVWAGAWTPGPW